MKQTLISLIVASLAMVNCNSASKADSMKDAQETRNPYYSRTDTKKLDVSDKEWKKVLPANVYAVAREADTEYAFTGKYWNFEGLGTYYCAV